MNWEELHSRSHTPYSGEPKDCLILGKSGKVYPGVRVENISFPLTIPAIQAACCFCLGAGDEPTALILKEKSTLEQQDFWVKEFDLEIQVAEKIDHLDFASLKHDRISENDHNELQNLLNQARTINSDFPVSSLLYAENGDIYSGVNIEVSDWTKGLCAERTAIAKAITDGNRNYSSMCLLTAKGEFNSPCGACRQVIIEHLPSHPMSFYHKDGTQSAHFSNDLLPFSFTSNSLNK